MLPLRATRGLNIGVTGHRLNRISQRQLDRLTPKVRPLLEQMAQTAHTPAISLVSGLAEGADRHLAELALAAGYGLHALLPFARATYEEDFADEASRQHFAHLMDQAEHITALTGRRANAAQAYRRAGHAMLDQSDVLLALWDGRPARGPGGTAEVVNEACCRRIPVIHVSMEPRAVPLLVWRRQGGERRGRTAYESAPSRPCGPAQVAAMVSQVMRGA